MGGILPHGPLMQAQWLEASVSAVTPLPSGMFSVASFDLVEIWTMKVFVRKCFMSSVSSSCSRALN